jgi:glucokinase
VGTDSDKEKNGKDAKRYWVGIDLGGTKMMAVVYDAEFRPLARERKKTKAWEGVTVGLERIEKTVRDALAQASLKVDDLAGIGIGAPGALDLDKGVIIESPNLGWKNVNLRRGLSTAFGCAVSVLNDVDSGVYGEYALGAARNARCVVGVFPGTGIGGGCVYEGKLIRGATSSCMEIGHMPTILDGQPCGCGRRGCLETVASRLAIASAAAAAAYRGEAPHLLTAGGLDISKIKGGELASAIAQGDTVVEHIVRKAAWWLGRAMGGLVNLFAPDVLLLGGGLAEAMPEIYKKEVGAAVAEHCMPAYRGTYKLVIAQLGDDAVAAGAAAWARREVTEPAKR